MVDAHDVAVALAPETLLGASDALRAWAEARWPGATWHREWPLRARLEGTPPRLLVGSDSVANVSQILTLDRTVLTERVGRVSRKQLALLFAGIDLVLGR